MNEKKIVIWFLRHGRTRGNEEKKYVGSTDEPLSSGGRSDLERAKSEGGYPEKIDVLLSGPSKRCRETAALLFPEKMTEMHLIPEWTETDFGEFEYRTFEELDGNPAYQAWLDSGGTIGFPGGENREEFIRRCLRGWEKAKKILEECLAEKSGGPVLAAAFMSGGNIMAILSSLCGGDFYDYSCENGGGYICCFSPGEDSVPEEGRADSGVCILSRKHPQTGCR